MFGENDVGRLTRRKFLRNASLVAGSMAVAPILLRILDTRLKIGVLLPQSTIYPSMSENLLAGMQLYFDRVDNQASDRTIKLIGEEVGFGPALARQKARKLINWDQIDLVVGLTNEGTAAMFADVFEAHQTPFVVSNIGANIPRLDEYSPYYVHNNLGYWQANWATGRWAAQNLGQRTLMAVSFYDSGYDAPHAFRLGFEAAGGEIIHTHISHIPPSEDDNLTPLFAMIEETRPDFVYALYCGQPAADFVRAYAESGLTGQIPLAGSGFLVDEALLPAQGQTAHGIKSALPWALALDTPANRDFMTAYQTQTGRTADIFAMLGYDTARLIVEAVNAVEGDTGQTARFLETLDDARSTGHLYLREVRQYGPTAHNAVIAELDPFPGFDERIEAERSSLKTGWLNTYLSV
jgi:branched-chain amino acid transport system substrate-binding protein